MENRETIKITTPLQKHEVVLKEWLTGGEKRKISNSMLEGYEFSQDEVSSPKIKGDMITRMQDVTFETVIVSIDGKTDKIVETLEDMRSEDYDFVIDKVNEISGQGDETAKKSQTTTQD